MVMTLKDALKQGEKTLAVRIRLYELRCQQQLLEKIESFGDMIMDNAVEQNREIQRMKETMNQAVLPYKPSDPTARTIVNMSHVKEIMRK